MSGTSVPILFCAARPGDLPEPVSQDVSAAPTVWGGWGGWGSNPRPADYESAALTG